MSCSADTEPALSPLVELSDDLTARILLRLKPREIAAASLTCKRLAAVCADERRVWQPLCKAVWSPHTDPERWLQRQRSDGSSGAANPSFADHIDEDDDEDKPLTTYRSLFAALCRLQPLIGLWRGSGDAPRGSLFRVSWAAGGEPHLEVVALRAGETEEGEGVVVEETTARVGPDFPGVALELVDEALAVLKDRPWRRTDPRWPGGAGSAAGGSTPGGHRGVSAAALAAAAVATGGHGPELLGASPPRSFGYEVLKFMQACVAANRTGSRKNRNRGSATGAWPGGGGPGTPYGGSYGAPGSRQPQIRHHFKRLSRPVASRNRPFSGFWTGMYGPHGLEIISISQSGSGPDSRLEATKVTGDPNVPAGQLTFLALGEPLPHPWPPSEVKLITSRPLFTDDPAAALAVAVAAVAAESAAAEAAAAGAAAAAAAPPPWRAGPGVLAMPVWAMPGLDAAAAAGEAAAEAAAVAADGDEPEAEGGPEAGPQLFAHLAALAAAAAEAEPVDVWDYLGPPPSAAAGGTLLPWRRALMSAATAAAAPATAPPRPSRVIMVYAGKGRVAGTGFTNPEWVDGRLWLYDNGSIGFLWLGRYNFLVDLQRMSPALLGRGGGGSAA